MCLVTTGHACVFLGSLFISVIEDQFQSVYKHVATQKHFASERCLSVCGSVYGSAAESADGLSVECVGGFFFGF